MRVRISPLHSTLIELFPNTKLVREFSFAPATAVPISLLPLNLMSPDEPPNVTTFVPSSAHSPLLTEYSNVGTSLLSFTVCVSLAQKVRYGVSEPSGLLSPSPLPLDSRIRETLMVVLAAKADVHVHALFRIGI